MDIMQEIRKKAKTEEVDYLFLMDCLATYKQPRAKLTKLLKSGAIVRVKKGLYCFGKPYRRRPYSQEVLANLIYGPSYVSYESALAYYNLIPESVKCVTSATNKRIKHFATPIGEFVYYYLPSSKFSVGVTWEAIDEETHFLIATKEKALADTIARLDPFLNEQDLHTYLVEGMRIDPSVLKNLRRPLMQEIDQIYRNKNVSLLCEIDKK